MWSRASKGADASRRGPVRVRKENGLACLPRANTRVSWGRSAVS